MSTIRNKQFDTQALQWYNDPFAELMKGFDALSEKTKEQIEDPETRWASEAATKAFERARQRTIDARILPPWVWLLKYREEAHASEE